MTFGKKTEFYSDLKRSAVNDIDYENPKYINQSLKMRSLDNLNDPYIAQDVILLSQIIENRFQVMHETYAFNPRKCNLASSISDYNERGMSRILIALPTKLKHVEIF